MRHDEHDRDEHDEIESLLGAYALDAVEPEEARAVEQHLATCPRCRAEVAAHRQVASLLGGSGAEAPIGLWERIAAGLDGDRSDVPPATALMAQLRPHRRRWRIVASTFVAAAVAAVVLLSLQVTHLDRQVDHLRSRPAAGALASAVATAEAGPHQTIELASTSTVLTAQVVVAAGGGAYWVASDLKSLPAGKTYQLWGLAHGRIVSLGLLGPDATRPSAFRLESGTTKLMVTAEPEGGTPAPTSPVLVAADVPPAT